MPEIPTYIPTFRSRQQENLVLREFNFGDFIYPMIEIIKPYDRKRPPGKQLPFAQIYLDLIKAVQAEKVFVDLPVSLIRRGAMKDEVLSFYLGVIRDQKKRTDHLIELKDAADKIIPVISSYRTLTGEVDTLQSQRDSLEKFYNQIAVRTHYSSLLEEWEEIMQVTHDGDYLIIDFDTLAPYPSPTVKKLMAEWKNYTKGEVVILRSSINMDISNVGLDHNEIVYEVDNGLIDMYKGQLKAGGFADYAGVKKDDLTTGGTISPGFLLYDPTENNFFGFKGNIKDLSEFEETIVPAILNSEAARNMESSSLPYLKNNPGWAILESISRGEESGKSQAKFKKIAILHYLHCIKTRIESGDLG